MSDSPAVPNPDEFFGVKRVCAGCGGSVGALEEWQEIVDGAPVRGHRDCVQKKGR